MDTRREFIKKICLILSALAFRRGANAKETVKPIIPEEVKTTEKMGTGLSNSVSREEGPAWGKFKFTSV